jgi:hypothetical protein
MIFPHTNEVKLVENVLVVRFSFAVPAGFGRSAASPCGYLRHFSDTPFQSLQWAYRFFYWPGVLNAWRSKPARPVYF